MKSVSGLITGLLYLILLQCVCACAYVCAHIPKCACGEQKTNSGCLFFLRTLSRQGIFCSCFCHFEHAGLAGWKASGSFSYLYFPSSHGNTGSRASGFLWVQRPSRVVGLAQQGLGLVQPRRRPRTKNVQFLLSNFHNCSELCFFLFTLKRCKPRVQFIQGLTVHDQVGWTQGHKENTSSPSLST